MMRNYTGLQAEHGYSGPLPGMGSNQYFTEFTMRKAVVYGIAALYVVSVSLLALVEPWLELSCPEVDKQVYNKFENPGYAMDPCSQVRYSSLLWFTRKECSFARRLVAALLLGGVIGWERRQADRPAGIRTMSLVSLGSCLFTINSAFAFIDGPMNWDASRISAAIPSGVGFLGAGLIFKKEDEETRSNVVHGLTTAASVWLSAAVGIACGGELYMPAAFGTALIMLLLRFGPRTTSDALDEDHPSTIRAMMFQNRSAADMMRFVNDVELNHASERTPLADNSSHSDRDVDGKLTSPKKGQLNGSMRSRASLAADV